MSRLQELVNAVAQVIINYYEETQSQHIDIALDVLYAKPHEQFIAELGKIIDRIELKGYQDRLPLLHYVKSVVNNIRPLVEKGTSLSPEEESLVKSTLKSFVANCGLLLKTDQGKKHSILYNGDTVEIKGCVRGVIGRYSYAVSGTVLNELFFSSSTSKFQFPLFPSPTQDQTVLSEIESTISTFINQHQAPLKKHEEQQKENDSLKKENALLKKQVEEQATRLEMLLKSHQDLQKKLEQQGAIIHQMDELAGNKQTLELSLKEATAAYHELGERYSALTKDSGEREASQEQALRELTQALKEIQQRIQSLTIDNTALTQLLKQKEEACKLLETEVLKLREENSTLRHSGAKEGLASLVQSRTRTPYYGIHAFPFFTGHNHLALMPELKESDTPSSPSPTPTPNE